MLILLDVAPAGTLLVSAVPAAMVIMILTQVVKRLGVAAKFAPLTAIILGILYTMLAYIVRLYPGLTGAWQALGAGLTLGLTASGLYSGSKALVGRSPMGTVGRATVVRDVPGPVVDGTAQALPSGKDGRGW